MGPAESTTMIEDKSDTPARIEIQEVESPTVQAKQAIGVFDSGSGGMVAAAYLTRILRDSKENLSVIFFGDTANLPYGKKHRNRLQVCPTRSSVVWRRSAPLSVLPAIRPAHRGLASARSVRGKDGPVSSASYRSPLNWPMSARGCCSNRN